MPAMFCDPTWLWFLTKVSRSLGRLIEVATAAAKYEQLLKACVARKVFTLVWKDRQEHKQRKDYYNELLSNCVSQEKSKSRWLQLLF